MADRSSLPNVEDAYDPEIMGHPHIVPDFRRMPTKSVNVR